MTCSLVWSSEETESDLKSMLERKCREMGLQVVDDWITKIIQIFDCKVARHGNMIVGKTGAGKSAAWKVLKAAMEQLCEDGKGEGEFQKVEVYTINPLALSNDEIYGCFDPGTHEWRDGILARSCATSARTNRPIRSGRCSTGPVDTLWIESMNTLLDDNKLLTLLSGERIMTVAPGEHPLRGRGPVPGVPGDGFACGYDLPQHRGPRWWPFVTSWQKTYEEDEILVQTLTAMLDEVHGGKPRVEAAEAEGAGGHGSICLRPTVHALFDAHTTQSTAIDPASYPNLEDEPEAYVAIIELTFSVLPHLVCGRVLDDDSRGKSSTCF